MVVFSILPCTNVMTNFPNICSGRLDKLLYVPLPAALDRVSVLRALSAKMKLDNDVDLGSIGFSPRAEGYSGADCAALLREAGLAVLKESVNYADSEMHGNDLSLCISARHFDYAFNHVMPSVSRKDQARYDRIRDRIARARSRGDVNTEDQGGTEVGTEVGIDDHRGTENLRGTVDQGATFDLGGTVVQEETIDQGETIDQAGIDVGGTVKETAAQTPNGATSDTPMEETESGVNPTPTPV